MSESTPARQRWNQRYAARDVPGEAAIVLRDNNHLLPRSGRALDLACGLGANALMLAGHGLEVDAADCSDVALEKLAGFARVRGLAINTLQCDIETDLEWPARYAVIVVSQYLFRPLLPRLVEMLEPGGLLYYQTFRRDKLSANGPSNPDYLLRRHELLYALQPLRLRYYREDSVAACPAALAEPTAFHDLACFVGQKALADQ